MIVIPGYQINEQIYESFKSQIYRGHREADNLPVILKVLRVDYPSAEELARYRQEYDLTRSLNVDGVIRAYDLHRYQHTLAMCLEDFGGASLDLLLPDRQLTLAEFLTLAVRITDILGRIHRQHVIHKDINPSNIVWNPETGQLRIIDFGLSTVLSREMPATQNPQVLQGTLAYISPEQTGRMNRSIDYRTDFYSLGVTFYELLTGVLPFELQDSVELVHAHIAKIPTPPDEINEAVPPVLSGIVMKLMAKTAEKRYQSAEGLRADLAECERQLKESARIETFSLGQNDISDRFQIPEKLYGRDEEIEHLLSIFDHATTGHAGMALCLGEPGVGKSALIHEIHKPIVEQRGYFIAGKYDQLQRNIPFTAITRAFEQLTRQILTESKAGLSRWKADILQGVGDNGQVIVDVIPELKLIIGPQPEVQPLPPAETQNRLQYVFRNFVRVISQPEHPLVLFLDDLQWADSASLNLLKALAADMEGQHFLIIGAYRDNEVDASHPLLLTLEEIKQTQVTVDTIKLKDLSFDHVNELAADALHCEIIYARPLAELVYEKTRGNAFFVTQFLRSLYEEGLLTFDFEQRGWQWQTGQIRARGATDNVVELMSGKISKLPPETQAVLQLAACIGNTFDLETLSVIHEREPVETFDHVWPGVEEGLVLPLDDNYRLILSAGKDQPGVQSNFKFLHDRVQQAAYALIPEADRQAIHLNIGRLLLATTPEEKLDEGAFDIVNHLNHGIALSSDETEKLRVAELNLRVGQRAKASTAYEPALRYLNTGVELLAQDDYWDTRYQLIFELYFELAECEYLCGHYERGEELGAILLHRAKSKQDQAKAYSVQIIQYTNTGKYSQAIETGQAALALFGIALPETELDEAIGAALQEIELNIGERAIKDLIDLPEMTDPDGQMILYILANMISPVYMARPEWVFIVVLEMVAVSLKYGNAKASAYAYDTYGVILGPTLGDYQKGYEFGLLALRLNEKFNDLKLKCQVYASFAMNINHWRKPLESSFPLLREAYQAGLEAGDLLWAGYVCTALIMARFAKGDALDSVYEEFERYVHFLEKTQSPVLVMAKLTAQSILNLQGLTQSKWRLDSEDFDQDQTLESLRQSAYDNAIHWYYLCQMKIFILYGKFEDALEMAIGSEKALGGALGQFSVAEHYFYHSVALAALYPKAAQGDREQYWEKLQANQAQMKIWAENCPENFQHTYLLVAAEMAALEGRDFEAMQLYQQALQSAKANGFVHNEALSNELAARFYLERGFEAFAAFHLKEAHYGYQLWGAARKVQDLEEQYPRWLAPTTIERDMTTTTSSSHDSDTVSGSKLDLSSVVKASQAISSEIDLDKLLARLIRIVVENAGARRGCLILARQEHLLIEAEWAVEQAEARVLQSTPIEAGAQGIAPLPVEIVQYVARTRESVVLGDAAQEGDFTHTPYVVEYQPRSILCVPLISQGELLGLIYLENELSTGVFNPERLAVLNLLSSQMAISLENATLYDDLKRHHDYLEELVSERTAELVVAKDAAEKARQLAEAANQAKSDFLTNMSHELRTPMNVILGYSQLMQRNPSLQPEQQKYLNTIDRSGEHLLALINSVLEISKIEARRVTLEPVTFDLHALLRDLEAMFRVQADARGLDFGVIGTGQVPRYVVADENKLRQVLINLLGNAVKFTREGGITMQVAVENETADDVRLAVAVKDSGVGIAAEELDKVFQYFEQTASGRQAKSGTGLGLFISRDYVRLMGGDITVTSRVGEGSTFDFEIDVKKGSALDLVTRQPRVIGLEPGRSVPRILVAEDQEESRTFLARLLELVGFEVREAVDGREAVEICEQWQPHFIWMDIRMPVMDGLEATRRIKATEVGQSTIIAALTAHALEEERERILAAGCDDFVRKPYGEQDIFRVLQNHLGVEYVYEEEQVSPQTALELSSEQLAALPADLRSALHKAVLELDTDRTWTVIEQIVERDAVIGNALKTLATQLDYGRLLSLLESENSHSGGAL